MKNMKLTPKSWSRNNFDLYILDCALRDRLSLYYGLGDNNEKWRKELEEEIAAMKNRVAALKKRNGE